MSNAPQNQTTSNAPSTQGKPQVTGKAMPMADKSVNAKKDDGCCTGDKSAANDSKSSKI